MIDDIKKETLTELVHQWWDDVFTGETSMSDLVDRIEAWLPKEHDTNSYKWNKCIRTIKEKLR
jgi:hypothetical protein